MCGPSPPLLAIRPIRDAALVAAASAGRVTGVRTVLMDLGSHPTSANRSIAARLWF